MHRRFKPKLCFPPPISRSAELLSAVQFIPHQTAARREAVFLLRVAGAGRIQQAQIRTFQSRFQTLVPATASNAMQDTASKPLLSDNEANNIITARRL